MVAAHLHGVAVSHAREAVAVLAITNSSAVGHVLIAEDTTAYDDSLEGKIRPATKDAAVASLVVGGRVALEDMLDGEVYEVLPVEEALALEVSDGRENPASS